MKINTQNSRSQNSSDLFWMERALAEAAAAGDAGEVPVGAVIVKDGQLIATGQNRNLRDHDPSAHAEIVALREAGGAIGNHRLENCEIYVIIEPCAMCAGALVHARLKRLIYGAKDPKAGAVDSVMQVLNHPGLNHQMEITGGVLEGRCAATLREFFRARRSGGGASENGVLQSDGKAVSDLDMQEMHSRRRAPEEQPAAIEAEACRLWNSNDRELWKTALDRYWSFVKPANLALEREVDQLDAEVVRAMRPEEWYEFLLEKYFRWKYTAANRYASTTKMLRKYAAENQLLVLHAIKQRLFLTDKDDIKQCLDVACSIKGLGTAGASGLLSILFPTYFGTVDQFVVKALLQVRELPERTAVFAMKPESLNINEGTILIRIMRQKATELNEALCTSDWTPRKVDMVLWACAR